MKDYKPKKLYKVSSLDTMKITKGVTIEYCTINIHIAKYISHEEGFGAYHNKTKLELIINGYICMFFRAANKDTDRKRLVFPSYFWLKGTPGKIDNTSYFYIEEIE